MFYQVCFLLSFFVIDLFPKIVANSYSYKRESESKRFCPLTPDDASACRESSNLCLAAIAYEPMLAIVHYINREEYYRSFYYHTSRTVS